MLKVLVSAEELAALPESDRAHYAQHEKGFRLQAEPVNGWALEDVAGLKRTLEERKDRHTKAQAELDALKAKLGDLDLDAAREALARPATNGKADIDKHVKAATEQLEAKYQERIRAAETRSGKLRDQVQKLLVDSQAAAVLAKKETAGSFALLQDSIRRRVSVEDADGGELKVTVMGLDGKPMYASRGNTVEPAGIEDLVKSLRDLPDYQPAFYGSQASGGGATGAGRSVSGNGAGNTSLSPEERLANYHAGKAG